MSVEQIRNVVTGEFRTVDTNSDEFREMVNERYDHDGSARPLWEQTGAHHAQRVEDNPTEFDFGEQSKPLPGETAVSPEDISFGPSPSLSLGEMEAGLKSVDQKDKELDVQPAESKVQPLDRAEPHKRRSVGHRQAGGKRKASASSSGSSAPHSAASSGSSS